MPDGDNLVQLAKVFGITVDELLNAEVEGSAIIKEKKLKKNSSAKIAIIIVSVIALLLVGTLTILHFTKKNEKEPEVIVEEHYQVSAGRQFSLYLDNEGNVSGMGENDYKQLNLEGWENIVEISAGGFHSLGLKEDGTVVATGYNNWGQIKVEDWSDIIQVSAGRYHSVGLKSDGTVVCVGGEKGSGVCDVKNWNGIIQVSAGRYGTVGLTEDGTLVYAGQNVEGLANFASWKNIVQVAAGTYHTVALLDDGTVLCTGRNGNKSCEVKDWTNIVKIAAGGYHTVGLKEDGTVVATGDNSYGQLNVASWENIMDISGGRYHTIAVTKDGEFLAIGDNAFGQLDGIKNNKKEIKKDDSEVIKNDGSVQFKEKNMNMQFKIYGTGEEKHMVITWDEVSNAKYYSVGLCSNYEAGRHSFFEDTEYTFTSYGVYEGQFTIYNNIGDVVKFCLFAIMGDGLEYYEEKEYTIEFLRLKAPYLNKANVILSDDYILEFPTDSHVSEYKIKLLFNGNNSSMEKTISKDSTSIDLKQIDSNIGEYEKIEIQLKYIGDHEKYLDSEYSNVYVILQK